MVVNSVKIRQTGNYVVAWICLGAMYLLTKLAGEGDDTY